jgi:HEAT repeat protein
MKEQLPPVLCADLLECLLENENASEPVLALAVELVPELARWNPNLMVYAIRAFREALYEPAIPLLGEALRDRSMTVRSEAQDTFAAFRVQREALEEFQAWMNISKEQRSTTAELVKLLASPQRDVVLGAVKALGALRAPTALPELVKLLANGDAELKAAVMAAIDACGGVRKPEDTK